MAQRPGVTMRRRKCDAILNGLVLNIMPGASHFRPSFKRISYHWSAVAIRHPKLFQPISHDNNLSVLSAQHLVVSPQISFRSPVDVAVLKFGLTLTEHGKLVSPTTSYLYRMSLYISGCDGFLIYVRTFMKILTTT